MPSNVELVAFMVSIDRVRALSGYVKRTATLTVSIVGAVSVTGYVEWACALEVEL